MKNKVEQFRKYYLRVFTKYDTMKELLDLILPGDVLAFFEVVKESTTSDQIDIYLDEKNIPPASMAVKAFYPRVSRARPGSRISRYVAGPFTFTFVDVNGNYRREKLLATSFPCLQMARVTLRSYASFLKGILG